MFTWNLNPEHNLKQFATSYEIDVVRYSALPLR